MRDHPPKEAKTTRLAREARALRANLARRKAQARRRVAENGGIAPPPGSGRAAPKPG
ncbi:MAG: hypothetical protein ACREFU_05330 [Acetobacteraceae bacterium]